MGFFYLFLTTLARYINVFRNKGYQVRGVSSLQEAYKSFVAKRPDCILSDLHFPDSNCIEDFYIKVITFQEKKKERLCPIVILTASDAKEDVEILTKARIHAVHLKSDRIDLDQKKENKIIFRSVIFSSILY